MLSNFGNAGLVLAFTFIGPLPFVPINTSVSLATGCTALVGFSYAFVMVSTFARAQAAAVRNGFTKNTETYHLISGNLCLIINCVVELGVKVLSCVELDYNRFDYF